jgi:hypothetical protein
LRGAELPGAVAGNDVSINNGRTLTDEEKQTFAYEIALGYFEDDELRRRFKLLPQSFALYKASEEINNLVLLKKREIDESDVALKIHARRAMRLMIDQYIGIVKDPEAPAKTRMEAGKQLRETAIGVDKQVLNDPETGGAVIIRTNLGMEGAKGVYTVTSQEIQEQLADNDRMARELHGNAAIDEIAALIGEPT